MLQYAVPNAPQPFQRPPSVFADPPHRPSNTAQQNRHNGNQHFSSDQTTGEFHHSHSFSSTADSNTSGTGLSALASLAANAPAAAVNPASTSGDSTSRSSTPNNPSATMASQQYPATAGGSAQPPTCANCKTSTTPLWRRDESGSVLCNACGLFLKLHGRPRPISLKTDVIKSRNRVKTSQPKKRDSTGGQDGMIPAPNGYPAAHPDVAHHVGLHAHQHAHGLPPGYTADQQQRVPSPGPVSRSNTPNISQTQAPPHIFDTVTLPSDTFASPSLPAFSLRNHSPAPSPLNGTSSQTLEPPHSYEGLSQVNQALRTRVSELEVINDLFKGRVNELETGEREAKQKVAELEKRIAELEAEGPSRKKSRTDETNGNGAENGVENGIVSR